MSYFFVNVLLSAAFALVLPSHLTKADISDADAVVYLRRLGYTPDPNIARGILPPNDTLRDSIRSFQRFVGLPLTGELDDDTKKQMHKPRCGNPDIAGTETAKRKKRYAVYGGKWGKKDLTYKVTNYTLDISPAEADIEFAAAFKMWESHSNLTFSVALQNQIPDIEIKFASGWHGDYSSFDGRGGNLAHAYIRMSTTSAITGGAHFDDDEVWSSRIEMGTANLRLVAAHEFGHSLGISHSDVPGAIMAPYYNPAVTKLHYDDIQAIQHLYGPSSVKSSSPQSSTSTPTSQRPVTTTTSTPRSTLTPPVGACNGRFDAITQMTNGSTYAFVGSQFWRLNSQGADEGFPQSTSSVWGITGKVDGALTYNGTTYIFQRENVYEFDGFGQRIGDSCKCINSVFEGIPSFIDAVFQWSGNGKIYVVKGDRYWRYNSILAGVDPGYPRSMKVWKGLPEKIDAALQWEGKTYFFSDGTYYRFDDLAFAVAFDHYGSYPRRTDYWWIGCEDYTFQNSQLDAVANIVENNTSRSESSSISRSSCLHFFILSFCLAILTTVFV